jgi:hypothetical protein
MDEDTLPWIDEAAVARQHPILFHYTRASALEQILRSGGLFATRADHEEINDPNELRALQGTFGALMMQSAIPMLNYAKSIGTFSPPDGLDLENLTREEARRFHDILVRGLPVHPHITCFSTHTAEHHMRNGLLTMWRLYGNEGGIALGFDTASLIHETSQIQRASAIDVVYLDPVLYGLNDPKLFARLLESPEVIQKFAENVMLVLQGRAEGPEQSPSSFLKFFVLSCCAKHPDFSDEREVRLVVGEADVHLENGRPRVEQPFPGRLVIRYLAALRQVMIGPSVDQDSLAESTRRVLDREGFPHIEILRSRTQFRFAKQY